MELTAEMEHTDGTRQIPCEILAAVFLASLPYDEYPTPESQVAPLLLMRVCRRWRRVVASSCRLWTSLHIAAPSVSHASSQEGQSGLLSIVDRWLARSGSLLPLSISLVSDSFSVLEKQLLCAILPYAGRWQRLRIRLPWSALEESLLYLAAAGVPKLESVDLDLTFPMEDIEDLSFLSFLSGRNVRALKLVATNSLPRWPVLWANLVHLELAQVDTNPALAILRSCSSLVHLKLLNLEHSRTSAPVCPLPLLRDLCIKSGVGIALDSFYRTIDAPVLEKFAFEPGGPSFGSAFPFIPLLVNAGTHLHFLALKVFPGRVFWYLDCLRRLPSLHELVLDGVPSDMAKLIPGSFEKPVIAFWRAFIVGGIDQEDLLPQLENLELRVSETALLSDNLLSSIITSRTQQGTRNKLKSLKARMDRNKERDLEHTFSGLLDLSLSYSNVVYSESYGTGRATTCYATGSAALPPSDNPQ
ncbi:unnamed protein product [Mycena citricolor]|uniref:F-box domain-containing protein n=1 Tax=Mycena citricolor TaxID=2018698 RepID=A0AAD2HMK4_9AGAR|nr:unnamed protein product [Mycena citricolor]